MAHHPSLVILFADVTGSAGMYERYGDEKAFRLITECLTKLTGVTERFGGSLVKTIGDEIMARFSEPEAATRASIEM